MPNSFVKQITVDFEDACEAFQDNLVASELADIYVTDQKIMERSSDTIWRPMPHIVSSFDGQDQSLNFKLSTQLAVPSQINIYKSVPLQMGVLELRDPLQRERLMKASMVRLATDVNRSVLTTASLTGSICVKRPSAMTGFDDMAAAEAIFNEQGLPTENRRAALSTRDYNGAASNLQSASRTLIGDISPAALRKAYVGDLCSFETLKLDYNFRQLITAAAGYTIDITVGSANLYTPVAMRVGVNGEQSPIDNRTQVVNSAAGTGIRVGDRFTITGVEAVHQISKDSSGQLKQFVVTRVISNTQFEISPPIMDIAKDDVCRNYGNVAITTRSATAVMVFLNTATAALNPIMVKGSIEVLPGRIPVPENEGTVVARATIKPGFEVVLIRWIDGKTLQEMFRTDCRWGVVNKNPQMNGVIMFGQP